MIFHFFGVFCGIFYLLLPFFKHTDEVNEKIGVRHVAQRFDRALAVRLDDALAAAEAENVDERRLPLFPRRDRE